MKPMTPIIQSNVKRIEKDDENWRFRVVWYFDCEECGIKDGETMSPWYQFKNKEEYNKVIEEIDCFRKTKIFPHCKNSWHLYTYFVNPDSGINRDNFVRYMEKKHNIHIVNRFWPIHLGGIMRMRGHKLGEAPICEQVWFKEQLSLPISPQIPDEDIDTIVDAVKESVKKIKEGFYENESYSCGIQP